MQKCKHVCVSKLLGAKKEKLWEPGIYFFMSNRHEQVLWKTSMTFETCQLFMLYVDYGFNNNKHTLYWCLVMSFWLKVCIYSHTRGVKLGLGLGFMQTSQVLPHWLNQSFSFWTLSYTQRHCHVRIEKGPVQTVAIILEAHNFLEYHYML